MPSAPEVGVVVVTHAARHHLARCLPPLLDSPLRPRVIVVNSSSEDGTVEEARRLGADSWTVPRDAFNHGLTREAARRLLDTPVVAMFSPDAYAADEHVLERLTHPVRSGLAAVAYARQVASPDADPIERFSRHFNYAEESHRRSAADQPFYGSYLRFCSNAAAAWSQTALDRIGGFKPALVSEDVLAVCELLEAGEHVAYAAEAVVEHTHRTSLAGSFRRHFDIGYARSLYGDLLLAHGGDEGRGRVYFEALIGHLTLHAPGSLPYACLDSAARLAGYRVGRLGARLPRAIATRLSGQDYFWRSPVATMRRRAVPVQAA